MDGLLSLIKRQGSSGGKKAVASVALLALGSTFELVSGHSSELKKEIADWQDGVVMLLGVFPDGPAMSVKKENGGIRFLGMGMCDADLKVLFKNLDSAMMVLTGQMGAHTAFAQCRAVVYGNLGAGMQLSRALNIVQKFILPSFMLNRTFKRPPVFSSDDLLLKARVMATLAPRMISGVMRRQCL